MSNSKAIFRKVGRIFLWLIVGIFSLLALLLIFINLPIGKKFVRNKAESFLQDKLQTKVRIGAVDYSLPEWIKIKGVYIEDQKKDTLLYGEELSVDINMLKLINGNIDIQKIGLTNISINVNRPDKDSVFNYQFIINAFSGNNPSTQETDTAALKMSLDRFIINRVSLSFKDNYAGSDFYAAITELDLKMNKFQPDRMKFYIDELFARDVRFNMHTYKGQSNIGVDNAVAVDTVTNEVYPLILTAGKVNLENVNVTVNNRISGLYYGNNVNRLNGTGIIYHVGDQIATAHSLSLDSSSVKFVAARASTLPPVDSSAIIVSKPWTFGASDLKINKVDFNYDDNNKPVAEGLDYAHLKVKDMQTIVSGFRYTRDSITARVSQFGFYDSSGFRLDSTRFNLIFTDQKLSLTDLFLKTPGTLLRRSVVVSYDSLKAITSAPQNSKVMIALDNSRVAFNDLFLLVPALRKSLGGFANQYLNINTEINGTLQRVELPFFQISGLSGSRLNARGTIFNLADTSKIAFNLYIIASQIFKRDLMKMVPPANRASLKDLPEIINLSGHFVGNSRDITADISTTAKDFAFKGRLVLNNFNDPAKLKYNVSVGNIAFDRDLIVGFIPPETLETLVLPKKISASGKFSGNAENIDADMTIKSSYGPLRIDGYVHNLKNTSAAKYDMVISTPGFELGKLIKQDSILGKLSGTITAKGIGFDYKKMRSSFIADLENIEYNKYNYKNVYAIADLNLGRIATKGNINDVNLKLNYDLNANVSGQYPTVKGLIRVDTVQFKPLNLYSDTLNLSLTATVDSRNLTPRNLDFDFLLDSVRTQTTQGFFSVDSISVVGTSALGIDSINLRAPFASVKAGGAFDYDKVGYSIMNFINGYYKIPGYVSPAIAMPEQQLAFSGQIINSPIVRAFVPGLTSYKDINFQGSYSSANEDSALNLSLSIPGVEYSGNRLSNGSVGIVSTNKRINYELAFDTLTTTSNTIYKTTVKGAAAHDSISLTARTEDSKNDSWFALSGTAVNTGEVYSFRLQDTLLLNYEKWNVAPDNYFSYSPQGIVAHNIRLASDTASIFISSIAEVPNSPININVDNFNLRSITSLLNQDTVFVAGIMDVKANVADFDKQLPSFIGNASVTDLAFMQYPLGNLTASANKESDSEIAAKVNLEGAGNDVKMDLKYYLNNINNQFDANVLFNQLNFKAVEAFSAGQIIKSKGSVNGSIKASGKFTDPVWNGELNFDTAAFTIAQLGAPFKIDKQRIVFSHPKISFPSFTIIDSLNHPLKINGDVTINSMDNIALDLDMDADDFVFVSSRNSVNRQIYGYGALDANVTLSGTAETPKIDGDILISNNSNITLVLPPASYAKDDGATIVRFVDEDTFDINPPPVQFVEAKKPAATFGRFLNYNLNIEINKEATLSMVIDPVTGDQITVQGDARLNAGVDPGGNIVLAGTYELDRGSYDLHYQILDRRFNLVKGSTIVFAGDPLNSNVNITAEYIANTNSRDLLGNEVSDIPPNLANSFNQKLPFRVILKMTGQLRKPNIEFDIQLPEENSNVLGSDLRTTIENKLQQIRSDPASVNKQVFSLLLMGRFVGEQSSDFFKGNGGDFNTLARQSVSQFLSSALNEIASDVFKGVDIDLNLNSYTDFSGGGNSERTDLNVAVSKRFANDRITISVGQNFGVQGGTNIPGVENNSGFRPDVSATYKLTPDGRYMLRAYTKNQFETTTVEGFVMETGLAFLITMDYEKFRELFRRKKK